MNRRDALSIGGATVAAAVAGSLIACADKKKPEDQPAPPPASSGTAAPPADPHAGHVMGDSELAMAAAHCGVAGDACLSHCLTLLGNGDTTMVGCAKAVRDMLAVCGMMGTLASSASAHLKAAAALCASACKDCQAECDKHADKHAECKACRDACGHMLERLASVN